MNCARLKDLITAYPAAIAASDAASDALVADPTNEALDEADNRAYQYYWNIREGIVFELSTIGINRETANRMLATKFDELLNLCSRLDTRRAS